MAVDVMFRQERAMAADDVSAQECEPAAEQLARAFEFLGKRWTAVILGHLSHGPAGFRELSRGIGGISDSVLVRAARQPGRGRAHHPHGMRRSPGNCHLSADRTRPGPHARARPDSQVGSRQPVARQLRPRWTPGRHLQPGHSGAREHQPVRTAGALWLCGTGASSRRTSDRSHPRQPCPGVRPPAGRRCCPGR